MIVLVPCLLHRGEHGMLWRGDGVACKRMQHEQQPDDGRVQA